MAIFEKANFTIDDLIKEVKYIAKKYPSNIYLSSQCTYTNGKCLNGTVGCIFGQALVRLGWIPDSYMGKENSVDLFFNDFYITDLAYHLFDGVNADKVDWCQNFQELQDEQIEWGKILIEMESNEISS